MFFDAIKDDHEDFLNDDRAGQRLFRKSMPSIYCMMAASMGDVVNLKRFKKRTELE